MKNHGAFIAILALLFGAAQISAQEQETVQARQTPKIDAIFDEMMMTFPAEVRNQIDSSASRTKGIQKVQTRMDGDTSMAMNQRRAREAKAQALQELPEAVRLQTESAIREMEKRQQERALEFKEMKRGGR